MNDNIVTGNKCTICYENLVKRNKSYNKREHEKIMRKNFLCIHKY
jgi:hypothetical protein